MNDPKTQEIITRYFQVVRELKKSGRMKFIKGMCANNGIDYKTFQLSMKNPASQRFQISWIVYLCKDYGVSHEYILFGKGDVFKK